MIDNKLLEDMVALHKEDVILWITTGMISEMPKIIQIGIHRNGHNYKILSEHLLDGRESASTSGWIRERTKTNDFFNGLKKHIGDLANLSEYYEIDRFDENNTGYIIFQRDV